MIKRLNGSIPSRNANTATAAAAILFLPGAENEKRLQTVHIMVEQEENIPRTRTTEKTAPSTKEKRQARNRRRRRNKKNKAPKHGPIVYKIDY